MRHFAWADLHGRLDLFEEGLKYINTNDVVYFLGDAADRGLDGWKIIKKILDDSRFIYIKGNHEDLMVKAIGKWHGEDNEWYWSSDIELWYYNGGEVTHSAFLRDKISIDKKVEYLNKLHNLPFCAVYTNQYNNRILLSHAGCDDFETANDWDEEKFIWDRHHLAFYDTWYGKDDEYIVHGHTPIELMIEEQEKNAEYIRHKTTENIVMPTPWDKKSAYYYGQGHKINIDTGAVWNNNSILLDLDTWEEIHLSTPIRS